VLSKGIVLKGDRKTEIVTEEVPAPSGMQVLVRTQAVGLCGSDLSLYHGTYEGPKNYPLYFGHEWSGTVEAVGPAVTRLKPGDKVTGDCSIYCGECEFCPRDKNLCQRIEKFGITIDGASRQRFLQEERYLYQADPRAELDLVALSEPLAVGAHAVRRVREARPELKHERILVSGGGAIGLACLFALKYGEGCEHVELFDLVQARVDHALELGATPLTDVAAFGHPPGEAPGSAAYGQLYSGRGYDAIFETSAAPAAFRQAVEMLRPLGTIMALGFIPSVEFSMKQITFKAARIMGSMGGTGDFDRALGFVLGHPDAARHLITDQVPFDEYERAFQLAQDRRNNMKVLIRF
jgi:L-iditol 2-dehydrogenase